MGMVTVLTALFMVTVIVLTVAAAFSLWFQNASHRDNSDLIREALSLLLQHPAGSYLIIEEPATGKFVQFSGSTEEPLFFDLPQQTLSQDEFEKARDLFSELGYPGPETFELFESSDGPSAGSQTSFLVTFGDDIEKATELAIAVFESVFEMNSAVQLKLTNG